MGSAISDGPTLSHPLIVSYKIAYTSCDINFSTRPFASLFTFSLNTNGEKKPRLNEAFSGSHKYFTGRSWSEKKFFITIFNGSRTGMTLNDTN